MNLVASKPISSINLKAELENSSGHTIFDNIKTDQILDNFNEFLHKDQVKFFELLNKYSLKTSLKDVSNHLNIVVPNIQSFFKILFPFINDDYILICLILGNINIANIIENYKISNDLKHIFKFLVVNQLKQIRAKIDDSIKDVEDLQFS